LTVSGQVHLVVVVLQKIISGGRLAYILVALPWLFAMSIRKEEGSVSLSVIVVRKMFDHNVSRQTPLRWLGKQETLAASTYIPMKKGHSMAGEDNMHCLVDGT
jgi:hypothetical protein